MSGETYKYPDPVLHEIEEYRTALEQLKAENPYITDSLISERISLDMQQLSGYPFINLKEIYIPWPRPHAVFTHEQKKELLASIINHGFIEPIVLRKREDGILELSDGQNRLEACTVLGYEKLPYIIVESDEKKALLVSFQKNYARGYQNPVDGAEAIAAALQAGATEEDIARWTGHTVQWVRRMLVINDLPDEFKEALRKNRIPLGVVFEASKLGDPELIYQAIKTAIDLGWGVKEMAFFVSNKLEEIKKRKIEEPSFTPNELGSIEEAKKLARLRTCDICHLQYDMDDVWAGIVCHNCLGIIQTIRSLEPDPVKALEFVQQYIVEYKERKLLEELKKKYEGPTTPSGSSPV
jgi:ParB family chromosome partitioning protein